MKTQKQLDVIQKSTNFLVKEKERLFDLIELTIELSKGYEPLGNGISHKDNLDVQNYVESIVRITQATLRGIKVIMDKDEYNNLLIGIQEKYYNNQSTNTFNFNILTTQY